MTQINTVADIFVHLEKDMEKACHHLEIEFNSLRTGRASVRILDNINVDYYGTSTPIHQVANISTPDPRTILIKPWEKPMIAEISKAIKNSKINLNPQNNGDSIILNIPQQTEEGRREVVKRAKEEMENAKISIRNCRRVGKEFLKKLEKTLSEDEMKREEEKLQKITDEFTKKAEESFKRKEKEIMTI